MGSIPVPPCSMEQRFALAEQGPLRYTYAAFASIFPMRSRRPCRLRRGRGARQRGWGLQHCAYRRSPHLARGSAGGGRAPRLDVKRRSVSRFTAQTLYCSHRVFGAYGRHRPAPDEAVDSSTVTNAEALQRFNDLRSMGGLVEGAMDLGSSSAVNFTSRMRFVRRAAENARRLPRTTDFPYGVTCVGSYEGHR